MTLMRCCWWRLPPGVLRVAPGTAVARPVCQPSPSASIGRVRRPEIAWSGERALPGDAPADDEGLDFSSSFVGDQGFHVAQVPYDMEVEQDSVAA
jgi:hypothetical protein